MSEFHDWEKGHLSDARILNQPEAVRTLPGKVRMVYDESFWGGFERIEKALNVMAESDWTPKAMAIHGIFFGVLGQTGYVIVEKLQR